MSTGVSMNTKKDYAALNLLRGKGPLELLYRQSVGDRSMASRLEYRVKRLPNVVKQDVKRLPDSILELLTNLQDEAIKKAG